MFWKSKRCCKEKVLSKPGISLHFGIRDFCTGADTCSPAPCQRGLTRGLRCMKKPTQFVAHVWTSRPYVWSERLSYGHISATSFGSNCLSWEEHTPKYQTDPTSTLWRSTSHDCFARGGGLVCPFGNEWLHLLNWKDSRICLQQTWGSSIRPSTRFRPLPNVPPIQEVGAI